MVVSNKWIVNEFHLSFEHSAHKWGRMIYLNEYIDSLFLRKKFPLLTSFRDYYHEELTVRMCFFFFPVSIILRAFSAFFSMVNIHNIKLLFKPIFSVQFNGIRSIHMVVQPSLPSVSRTFLHSQTETAYPSLTLHFPQPLEATNLSIFEFNYSRYFA